jgi:predicted dehydrogenase
MNPLNLVVIGTGALGKHHARILSTLPGVRLAAIAELNEAAGRDLADKYGARWVADYREVLGEVDAAVVAVPTQAHWAVSRDLLLRRIPLLVEKPLAADLNQARQLVSLARQNETLLQVGHVERFNAAFVEGRRHIGSPKYIRGERFSPFAFRSTDIGVVHDMMIHDIDLVLSLVKSDLVGVEAFGVQLLGHNEDCVQARLRFKNGCIADLSANRVSPVQKRHMQVWSCTGCTDIDFGSREVAHYAPTDLLRFGQCPVDRARQPGVSIDTLKKEVFESYIHVDKLEVPASDALTAELTEFVDCLRSDKRPQVAGEEALAALTVADRVLASVAQHQWSGDSTGPVGQVLLRESDRLRKAA